MRLAPLVARRGPAAASRLITHEGSLTRTQWLRLARALAGELGARGLGPHDRLLLALPNGLEAAVWELAAAIGRMAVVGVPTGARLAELTTLRDVVRPRALVYPPGGWTTEAEAVFGGATKAGTMLALTASPVGAEAGTDAVPCGAGDALGSARGGDPVRLFATSGTTANPKIVVHTQDEVAFHAREAAGALALTPRDVMLCALPMAGAFGHAAFWSAVVAGAEIVLEPDFDAQRIAETIGRERVTCLFGSDTMLRRLMGLADADRLLSSLAWAGFAAFGGAGHDLVGQAEREFGLLTFQVYGSSEAQALVAARSTMDPAAARALAGGRLVDRDMAVRVVDPDDRTELARGQTGELELRGRSVFRRYFDNADATARVLQGGWYRTGDLGRVDADGALTFVGRRDDALRLGGYLVDPAEVEDVLRQHPALVDAQVVSGAPPGQRDYAVAFVLVRADAAMPADPALRAWCESRLARHKVPKRFVAVDRFPVRHGPNGDKIRRAVLREWAREGGAQSRT